MNKSIFILFIAIILNSCSNGQTKQPKLSATEFLEKIKATEDAVIVDVRTPEEFQKGHIQNALNLNWNGSEFEKQLATLDKNKTIFVYCLSGGRSNSAADKMRKTGFEDVIEMPGGMMEWRVNNLPETKINIAEKGMSLAQYQALLKSDKLVLVDFYADWCAPCKKMKPYLEKIAVEMANKVTLVRIDADQNAELCKKLNITALPVLKLYKNNELVWENEGYIEEESVRKQLK
ncbi:thioredoxin domain-containing protein [Flavobacterium sp. FlaQc-28]|uniref:thioredoxin domain-containing protein n=1 Tax=Flavobacterium sp. FlaQc-28 TaxID=3374178 RepID=UPI0037581ED2